MKTEKELKEYQEIAEAWDRILSKITETEKEREDCLYCGAFYDDEEHICYTCCGDEITAEIEDIGLCPTCLEHI
jgi:hypothetical protein